MPRRVRRRGEGKALAPRPALPRLNVRPPVRAFAFGLDIADARCILCCPRKGQTLTREPALPACSAAARVWRQKRIGAGRRTSGAPSSAYHHQRAGGRKSHPSVTVSSTRMPSSSWFPTGQ